MKAKAELRLTRRALRDIRLIFDFSRKRRGKQTAETSLDELEAGFGILKEHPDLLRPEPDFHAALRFYRVNRYLLVGDVQPGSIVVLTVIHASRDLPARLAELQPTLATEVEILHHKLHAGPKRKGP